MGVVSGRAGGQHAGGDTFDDVADVSGRCHAVFEHGAGRSDRPARVVAEHDDQRGVQHAGAVLDAAQYFRSQDMPGGPNDEEVAEPAVEDDPRGQPGVGAAEQDRERALRRGGLRTARCVLVGVFRGVGDEPLVAVA